MKNAASELLQRALELAPGERLELAREILESVGEGEADELSDSWLEEIQRRVDRVVAGSAGPDEDWRIVLDRIRRQRAERSA